MRKHALLSASSAHRWLQCPPSARLEAEVPDSTSEYAAQGTAAHAYAEILVRRLVLKTAKDKDVQAVRKQIEQYYDDEMEETVQRYVAFVEERLNAARKTTKDAVLLLEQRLDFSRYVPEGFGTGDAVIIADGNMEVIDFKYGQGVPVYAENNPQARLYALGAIDSYDGIYDITHATYTIHQPRIDNISSFTESKEDIVAWGEKEVAPIAAIAFDGGGEFMAGEHCRFCRIRMTCRARAEEALSIVRHDFESPPTLSDDEIPGILQLLDRIKSWLKDIEDYAYDKAVRGYEWEGFKLVEGRSNRTYIDELLVADALADMGDDIWERKLKGITAMEKLLGKKAFEERIGELVIKPPGKPTLVPISDKREAISSAEHDFNEEM